MTWRQFLTALGCAAAMAAVAPACTLDVAAIRAPAPTCDVVDSFLLLCDFGGIPFGYYHDCTRDFSDDCRRCIDETTACGQVGSRCKALCAPVSGSGSLKNPDGGVSDLAR